MLHRIRLARNSDTVLLPGVERSAGESFRALPDLSWIADEVVGGEEIYQPRLAEEALWVTEDDAGGVVGFLSAQQFGKELHIWELAVAQPFQRRGLGRGLLDAACTKGRAEGLTALTLTTFRHVEWNAPFYMRYGFRILESKEIGDRLMDVLHQEAARALPNRCAMRLLL